MQILQTSGPTFRSSEDFLHLIKTHLCVSLSRNGVSAILELFEMALFNFLELLDKFKVHLKVQIEVSRTFEARDTPRRLGPLPRDLPDHSRNIDQFVSAQVPGHPNTGEDRRRRTDHRRSVHQLRLFDALDEHFRATRRSSIPSCTRPTGDRPRLQSDRRASLSKQSSRMPRLDIEMHGRLEQRSLRRSTPVEQSGSGLTTIERKRR